VILDENGCPVDPRANVATATHVVDGLPAWFGGASYRADDDVITLRVAVPASQVSIAHLLACEMTPEAARAVRDVIDQLIRRSEMTMTVLDVPSVDSAPFR
jgi:hypothetical protein